MPASLMNVMPDALIKSSCTVEMLIGSVAGSAGSFCAVTVTDDPGMRTGT